MTNGETSDAAQLAKIEQMKKQILTRILTRETFERLARVRLVNPELAGQAELYLLQIAQQGKLSGLVTEDQLREILKYLSGEANKKETKIRRL